MMRFKVKIDKWIIFTFYGSVLMFLPLALIQKSSEEMIVLFGVMGLMTLIMIPLIKITYYEFRDDHLFIRMGYIHSKIKYEKVKSVKAVNSWGKSSGFALSKERVEIEVHGKSTFLRKTTLSPLKREQFMIEMKRHCVNMDGRRAF